MYKLAIKESLDKKFKKLRKKDTELLLLIDKKVQDIVSDPFRFKPLKKPLQNKREEKRISIYAIEHRSKDYKSLKRRVKWVI